MKTKIIHLILLTVLLTAGRILYKSGDYTHFSSDPPLFAMAVDDYSLEDYRPHLPGYFLHVQLSKVVTYFGCSPSGALIYLSIVYSILGAIIFYLFAAGHIGNTSAFYLTILMSFNPFIWFFSCISEIYIVELFLSLLLLSLGNSRKGLLYTPLLAALGCGIRPSTFVLLMPLYLYLWARTGKGIGIRKIILSHIAGVVAGLAWFMPMIYSAGGFWGYIELYSTNSPFKNLGILQNLSGLAAYGIYLFFPLFIVLLIITATKSYKKVSLLKDSSGILQMLAFWVIPPLLFFIFFHYSKGYYAVIAGAVFVFIMLLIKHKLIKDNVLVVTVFIEILIFLFIPYKVQVPEIDFNPKSRKLSSAEVFFNRMQSNFVMGVSAIKEKNRLYASFDSAFRKALAKNIHRHSIFVDPSINLFIRALQLRYPAYNITYLNKFKNDEYFLFSGTNTYERQNIHKMLIHSLCCSRKSFFDKYLQEKAFIIFENNDYIFYTADSFQMDTILKLYKEYYYP